MLPGCFVLCSLSVMQKADQGRSQDLESADTIRGCFPHVGKATAVVDVALQELSTHTCTATTCNPMLCNLQAVQHAQQALQAAEESGQQQANRVAPILALIALLLSARCVL
jgi:hypothetical protein